MSWFYRAGLTGLAVACLFTIATVTAFAKYPDDNGNHYGQLWNPGHHYGQLKHRQSPPPAPVPSPAPGTHPSTTGSSTSHSGGGHGGQSAGSSGGGDHSGPAVNPPAGGGPSLSPNGQIEFVAASPSGGVSWLVLLLVPALAACG